MKYYNSNILYIHSQCGTLNIYFDQTQCCLFESKLPLLADYDSIAFNEKPTVFPFSGGWMNEAKQFVSSERFWIQVVPHGTTLRTFAGFVKCFENFRLSRTGVANHENWVSNSKQFFQLNNLEIANKVTTKYVYVCHLKSFVCSCSLFRWQGSRYSNDLFEQMCSLKLKPRKPARNSLAGKISLLSEVVSLSANSSAPRTKYKCWNTLGVTKITSSSLWKSQVQFTFSIKFSSGCSFILTMVFRIFFSNTSSRLRGTFNDGNRSPIK